MIVTEKYRSRVAIDLPSTLTCVMFVAPKTIVGPSMESTQATTSTPCEPGSNSAARWWEILSVKAYDLSQFDRIILYCHGLYCFAVMARPGREVFYHAIMVAPRPAVLVAKS